MIRRVLMFLWTGVMFAGFLGSGLFAWRGPEAYVAGMFMSLVGAVIAMWPLFLARAAAIRKGSD